MIDYTIIFHRSTNCSRFIKGNFPAIESLRRPEVVHKMHGWFIVVIQNSKLCHLGFGDLEGLDEVDPDDNLFTARGGKGARVGAVDSVFPISFPGRCYQVRYL